jgi:hypothetical protein
MVKATGWSLNLLEYFMDILMWLLYTFCDIVFLTV